MENKTVKECLEILHSLKSNTDSLITELLKYENTVLTKEQAAEILSKLRNSKIDEILAE